MPTEVARIQNQLQGAFEGEAWHGPSLMELLADVDADKAAARPIAEGHSIWELVLHIAAWDKAVADRLLGGRGPVSAAENFPAVTDTSEAAWQGAIETLKANHRKLIEAMAQVEKPDLMPVVEGMSSAYVHMHGAVQHDLYHAGQIAAQEGVKVTNNSLPLFGVRLRTGKIRTDRLKAELTTSNLRIDADQLKVCGQSERISNVRLSRSRVCALSRWCCCAQR